MATVTTITGLLKTALAALAGVDQASDEHYLPPVKTEAVALVIPPYGQQTSGVRQTATRGTWLLYHRIRCEFWVKLNSGAPATAITYAKELGRSAIVVLLTDATLNNATYQVGYYGNNTPQAIEADVTETPIVVGGMEFIVVSVIVPIVDYSG